jgi:2-polyprenyl-3-methyl-5-hydroxy-6-metoxy-1,4-benzoquinol methylase
MTTAPDPTASAEATPWLSPWPAASLEPVPHCPVCGSGERQVMHGELVDDSFRIAAGHWTLYRCAQCRCAWLDPRPDRASIGSAYGNYYTHAIDDGASRKPPASGLRRLRLALFNGYTNARYGTQREPASRLGPWLMRLAGRHRQRLDAAFRYLPRPRPGQTLLDLGCGNGDFLLAAREAGWTVRGIDPDPQAVELARQRGLDARVSSLDALAELPERFDAITLSHVLEHLHDPAQTLADIHRLLRPGGWLYIDTPNVDSRGAARWGVHWRGLEAPRHLVLFGMDGLLGLLGRTGFRNVQIKRRTVVRKFIYLSSLRMQQGHSPYARHPRKLPPMMRLALKYLPVSARHDEFLTLLARRTDNPAGSR